ncbi:MAG: BON domain-containing protein [Sulfurimonas sp.]
MKKIITTVLLTGSLMSIFGATALFAEENQSTTIEQKAKAIVHDAKVKADKMMEDAKAKAAEMIEKAKEDAAALKKESAESMKETSAEVKTLANEAMETAKAKGNELVEKTKAMPQAVKQGVEEKYVYTKKVVNETYEKSKDAIADARIHAAIKYAYLVSPDIHSMQIDVDVKDGDVRLFGKVKSAQEAEEAMQIALSIKGVWAVESFFLIVD